MGIPPKLFEAVVLGGGRTLAFSAASFALPNGWEIERANAGWQWNADGTTSDVEANLARYDFSPSAALLLETATVSPVTNDVTYWNLYQVTRANDVSTPDGGTNGFTITESSTTNPHLIYYVLGTFYQNQRSSFSVMLKAGTRRYVGIAVANSTTTLHNVFAVLDTETWAITSSGQTGNLTLHLASVENKGSGWYKLAIVFSSSAVMTNMYGNVRAYDIPNPAIDRAYLGDGSTIIVWRPQYEVSAVPSSRIDDFALSGTRVRYEDRLKLIVPAGVTSTDFVSRNGLVTRLPVAAGQVMINGESIPEHNIACVYWNRTGQKPNLVVHFHGDSLTDGYGATKTFSEGVCANLTALGKTVIKNKRGLPGCSWNYSWVGSGVGKTLTEDAVASVDPYLLPGLRNILVLFAGTNGLASGNSAAQEYADFEAYLSARLSAGFAASDIFVCTMLPRSTFSEIVRGAYNGLLVGGATTYGYNLVRLDTDATIGAAGAQNDTTYFYSDTVHLVNNGVDIVTALITASVQQTL